VERLRKGINDDKSPVLEVFTESRLASFIQGAAGNAHENKLDTTSWGFDVKDIKFKGVKFFHGDQDLIFPLWHAEYLAERFPGSKLRVYQGEDHQAVTKGWVRLQTILVEIMNQSLRSSMV
jgi:pimeloyl-ACP methyl ester carboxylesterase